ncbi:MAG TPA: heavy-metal-associated domain-containing protein [Longimicrobiaceae bacterium]|nr:heavy-metal-associated domain-containing protein [Longimicrobiaceae bacterium]
MPTQKLRVKGLRQEDETTVARRLRELDGVFCVVLSHADECAEVDFEDDRVSLDEIRAAVRECGYEAEIAG